MYSSMGLFSLNEEYAGGREAGQPAFPDSLEAEKAGRIELCHHVDLRLGEALFCEDSQSDSKSFGVSHIGGLTEIGAQHHILRTEGSNIRNLLRPVIHHRILSINDLRSST